MGWFDFLKKKKDAPDEARGTTEQPYQRAAAGEPSKPEQGDAAQPGGQPGPAQPGMSTDARKALQAEYTLLLFLDLLCANPLTFAREKRAQAKYLTNIQNFLESRPAMKEFWSQPGKNLLETVSGLMANADTYAESKGMTRSPQSFMNLITMGIFGGIFTLLIVSSLVPALQAVSSVMLYVGLCVVCIVPNFLKRYVMTKASRFQELHVGEFIKEHAGELDVLHDAVQYLLSDLREAMIDEVGDVSRYQIQLYNADYRDIVVLNSSKAPGRGTMIYAVRFLNDGEDPATAAMQAAAGVTSGDVDLDLGSAGGTGGGVDDDIDDDVDNVDDDIDTGLDDA